LSLIRPVIDLTKNHWTKAHGDLTVYGTWFYDKDDGWVPCLVILPTFRQGTPCIVSMDLSWIWSEEHGDPEYAAETATAFAVGLGLPPVARSCFRIASMIRDHLGDLLSIPPRPADDQIVVAEALVSEQDGKQRYAEIKEDV